MSLIRELRRRNVFRVAAAYVVASWVIMQVASVIARPLSLPDWFETSGFSFTTQQVHDHEPAFGSRELLAPEQLSFMEAILSIDYLKKASRACKLVRGWGGQPGMNRSTGSNLSSPSVISGLPLKGPPLRVQLPAAMTTLGAGTAS